VRALHRLLPVLLVLAGASVACSEDAAVELASEVAEDLGADPACVATVASMVRASVDVSDELVDGQREDLASTLDALESFVGAAPAELRADARTLFDAYAALATADDADDDVARAEAEAVLEGPEVTGARAAIGDWFDEHCTPDVDTTTTTLR
jgi:hypothetical protein